ncbi:MAG: hypothetical protein L6R19_08825 [Alphaproteobacteria bacterium]|nr:hypothetical protein [Alphaproteobacteria bacterium]
MAALLLAAAIIGLTMSSAIRRGMDHAVAISPDEQAAIAISLSRSLTTLKLGYLGLKQVSDKLGEYWNRDAQGWDDIEKLKSNYRDAALINAGLEAAASLGIQSPGYVSDGTLFAMNSNDIGQVDYVTLAFALFGTGIESLFYLYFFLVGLSAFVFILTFRDNICALVILLGTLSAYCIELQLGVFDPVAMPSYFGVKHGSTMCLVAFWHFVFLLLTKREPSPAVIVGSVVQLGILVLAWRMRSAVTWAFLFLFVQALATARPRVRLAQFRHVRLWPPRIVGIAKSLRRSIWIGAKSFVPFANATLRWPVVVLLAGLLGSVLYDRASLHFAYSTDDIMPGRGVWTDAYLGLAAYDSRVLSPRVAAAVRARGLSENVRWWVARDYMDRTRFVAWDGNPHGSQAAPGIVSEFAGVGIKAPLQEQYARSAFMEAVKRSPVRVLIVYLLRKPLHVLMSMKAAIATAESKLWLFLSLLVASCAVALVSFLGLRDHPSARRDAVWLSGVSVLAAAAPSLWSYANQSTMADSILLLAGFLPIAIGMAAAKHLLRRIDGPCR